MLKLFRFILIILISFTLTSFNNTNIIDDNVFNKAILYYTKNNIHSDNIIIIDLNQPSYKKRMWVYNIRKNTFIYNTYVSHGKNSGKIYATKFSNKLGSNMTSLGSYVTSNKYFGKHGLSIRLIGLDKGINDNAYKRNVVIHTAKYVGSDIINKDGYIGRSLGCPAIPLEDYKIIKNIEEGTFLFIYHTNYESKKK